MYAISGFGYADAVCSAGAVAIAAVVPAGGCLGLPGALGQGAAWSGSPPATAQSGPRPPALCSVRSSIAAARCALEPPFSLRTPGFTGFLGGRRDSLYHG